MSSEESERTVTRTRKQVEVQEVEEELFLCRNCDQAYEDDEISTVGVDLDEDGDPVAERLLCENCQESVLGYSAPDSVTEYVNETVQYWSPQEVVDAVRSAVVPVVLPAILLTAGIAGGALIFAHAIDITVDAVIELQSSPSEGVAVGGSEDEGPTLWDLVQLGVSAVVAWIVAMGLLQALRDGPGGGRRDE